MDDAVLQSWHARHRSSHTVPDGFHRMHVIHIHTPRCSEEFPSNGYGNTPVLNVLQPVAETAFTDALRNPVDGVVVADQIIFYSCHLDEPGFSCIVDQWCITTPAVWIVMLKFRCFEEVPLCPDLRTFGSAFLQNTCIRCLFGQITFSVYELYKRKVILAADTAVVFTKCRCDMNNTGTIAHGYVVSQYTNELSLLFCMLHSPAHAYSGSYSLYSRSLPCSFQNFVSRSSLLAKFAKYFVQKSFCHIISVSVCCFYFAVSLIRVHTKCHVGWQSPRCGGPCQEICILTDHFETNDAERSFTFYIPVKLPVRKAEFHNAGSKERS